VAARSHEVVRESRSDTSSGERRALLRWKACAQVIMRDCHLVPRPEDRGEPLFLE
jgi:hypothetical protein